jgi:hypothetical protein
VNLPAALLALLTQFCPWFDLGSAERALELPPLAYELTAEMYGFEPGRTLAFATWLPTLAGPRSCQIYLLQPTSVQVACHELRHCVEGYWHRGDDG